MREHVLVVILQGYLSSIVTNMTVVADIILLP